MFLLRCMIISVSHAYFQNKNLRHCYTLSITSKNISITGITGFVVIELFAFHLDHWIAQRNHE